MDPQTQLRIRVAEKKVELHRAEELKQNALAAAHAANAAAISQEVEVLRLQLEHLVSEEISAGDPSPEADTSENTAPAPAVGGFGVKAPPGAPTIRAVMTQLFDGERIDTPTELCAWEARGETLHDYVCTSAPDRWHQCASLVSAKNRVYTVKELLFHRPPPQHE